MDINEVFVLTAGMYSDYHIEAIFLNEPDAKLYRDTYCGGGEIERHFISSMHAVFIRQGLIFHLLTMTKEGEVTYGPVVRQPNFVQKPFSRLSPFHISDQEKYGELALQVYCFAKDEEHAIKIANERRTALIAMDKWEKGEYDSELNKIN